MDQDKLNYWLEMAEHVVELYGAKYTGVAYNLGDVKADAAKDLDERTYLEFMRLVRSYYA